MKLIDIHSPQDIKPLTIDDLKDLAKQMRAAIINYTSTTVSYTHLTLPTNSRV